MNAFQEMSEKREIAELMAELNREQISFRADCYGPDQWQFSVGYFAEAFETSEGKLVECLRECVNWRRAKDGKESLEDETERLAKEDAAHDSVIVEIPGRCVCGSDAPLVVKRQMILRVSWETGLAYGSTDMMPQGTRWDLRGHFRPTPGEIGACPACGKHYTFGPHE